MNATALHEAAHALAAREYSSGPVRAVLGGHPDVHRAHDLRHPGAGYCEFDLPSALPDPMEALRRAVIVTMAGPAAEQLALGRALDGPAQEHEIGARLLRRERIPPWERSASDRDAEQWLRGVLSDQFGDELYSYRLREVTLVECLRRVVRLLREHWGELESLAERLQREREVTI